MDPVKPTLAILAAGEGRRYGGSKQIDPINNHLLLEYSIYNALIAGYGRVVPLIRADIKDEFLGKYGQRIKEGVKSSGANFDCVSQEPLSKIKETLNFREKVLGTGYATLGFKDAVQEPFAVINADNFYGRQPFEVLHKFFNQDYDPKGNVHACVGYLLRNVVHSEIPVAKAICSISKDGFLEHIIERTTIIRKGNSFVFNEGGIEHDLDPDSIVSTTFWGFNPTIFPHLSEGFGRFLEDIKKRKDATSEFYLPDFIAGLIAEGKIKMKILQTEEQCFGMNYKKQKQEIEKEIKRITREGKYPDNLWEISK